MKMRFPSQLVVDFALSGTNCTPSNPADRRADKNL